MHMVHLAIVEDSAVGCLRPSRLKVCRATVYGVSGTAFPFRITWLSSSYLSVNTRTLKGLIIIDL